MCLVLSGKQIQHSGAALTARPDFDHRHSTGIDKQNKMQTDLRFDLEKTFKCVDA